MSHVQISDWTPDTFLMIFLSHSWQMPLQNPKLRHNCFTVYMLQVTHWYRTTEKVRESTETLQFRTGFAMWVDRTDFVATILGGNTLCLFIICSYTFHVISLGTKYHISRYTVMLFGVAQLYWVCSWPYTYYRILLLLLGLVFILPCRTYYFYVHTDFVTLISRIQPQTFNTSKYFVLADWHTLYIIYR